MVSQQENTVPLYRITSPTGKQYVGITTLTVNRRMSGHRTAARKGSSYPLHAAIRKYGFENMVIETLHPSQDIDELRALEVAAIANHNTVSPAGYNLTVGGEGTLGHVLSDEHRAAISARMFAKWLDPEFAAMRKINSSETARRMLSDPKHRERLRDQANLYWSNPENRVLRGEATRKRIQDNPEAAQRAVAAMHAGVMIYWENPEARAEQSARTKAARAAQTPERRKEIAQLGVGVRAKKRAEHEAYLATLPIEQAEQLRAEARSKKSAETKAGRAAATPEQKAASKERYRQAALRRTPEQLEKLKLARHAALRERIA